jgi:hypothetical protein
LLYKVTTAGDRMSYTFFYLNYKIRIKSGEWYNMKRKFCKLLEICYEYFKKKEAAIGLSYYN